MPTVLWIPIGVFVAGIVLGAMVGSRSRSGSAATGALVGGFISLVACFPLLSIGLSDL